MQALQSHKQLLQQYIFGHSSAIHFNKYSQAVLQKLSACHTQRIGMHVYKCSNACCNKMHYTYHSCGNRHCPNCGDLKREQWIIDRHSELLPTSYFHMVFTLPQQLRSVVMGNRIPLYDLLFKASTYTIRKLCADSSYLGAVPGIVSVLHTNGQDLSFHPHVHCIVTGGGVSAQHKWVAAKRANGKYLIPVSAMEKIYKAYYLAQLQSMHKAGVVQYDKEALQQIIDAVKNIKWNVYAKSTFAGPEQVINYLSRYTHKVAITAHRITAITDTHITFKYQDYADNHRQKLMTLTHEEFLRRFEQHILPHKFVKIRHTGFLSAANKTKRLSAIRAQLHLGKATPKVKIPITILAAMRYGINMLECPYCKQGTLQLQATYLYHNHQLVPIEDLRSRGSPKPIFKPTNTP